MKIKTSKIYLLTLIVTTQFLLCSVSCNRTPDVSQFISKEDFEKAEENCKYSTETFCALQPSFRKLEKHCSDNKLPADKCEEIKQAVVRKATDYRNEQIKETQRLTEQIKKMTK